MLWAAALLLAGAPHAVAADEQAAPECYGPGRWAASMAFARLKNAGLLHGDDTDLSRTTSDLVAAQKIGPDLYRQVTELRFAKRDGSEVHAITVSESSHQECSMGEVKVLVVDPKALGGG